MNIPRYEETATGLEYCAVGSWIRWEDHELMLVPFRAMAEAHAREHPMEKQAQLDLEKAIADGRAMGLSFDEIMSEVKKLLNWD